MPCYSPLTAYQPVSGGPLKFGGREPKDHRTIQISCGQCMGCRTKKSSAWAMRMMHEAQLHENNCFITLTYDEQHLPQYGSLYKPDLTAFWKRLRHHKGTFRYYACGEYGDNTDRPHYHACLFGIDFEDKTHFRKIGEHNLYISQQLTDIWGHGNTSIGSLTYETAQYTANYVTKKLSKGQARYVRVDDATGEIIPLVQPFAVMSLRCRGDDGKIGGIGSEWLRRYHADIYGADKDRIRIKGRTLPPAKYYDQMYEKIDHEHMAVIKSNRQNNHEGLTEQELRAHADNARARIFRKHQI